MRTYEKHNKATRGFTLVELIVVLVILAILAALLLPTLTKYIERTRETKAIAEARQVAVAGMASYAEYYVDIDKTPAGNGPDKTFIRTYFKDFMKAECNMDDISTLRTNSARNGNKYSVETGLMDRTKVAQLITNAKAVPPQPGLGGNSVEFYVRQKTYDCLVGLNYVSKDKGYLVTIIYQPQYTTDYKDVAPGSFIVQKIE